MYILRAGFLDGKAGWVLSNFISSYEFFIQTKYQELRRLHGRQLSVAGLSQPEGQLSFSEQTGVIADSPTNALQPVNFVIPSAVAAEPKVLPSAKRPCRS